MNAAVILVGAGRSTRLPGDRPKPLRDLDGLPILVRSALPFAGREEVAAILPVAPAGYEADFGAALEEGLGDARRKLLPVATGGETRQESVARGLEALPPGLDPVLVHDAARPFVSSSLIGRVLKALDPAEGVVPVLPPVDTVKEVKGERVVRTPDRSSLALVQTPQAFEREALEAAFRLGEEKGLQVTDDASLLEAAGYTVATVVGDPRNRKVTTPEDLRRESVAAGPQPMVPRVGTGLDFHTLVAGRELWLGGGRIEHDKGLAGHSDGDVICHAAADALLGAAALGDLGFFFPDTDPRWEGACSLELLREVARKVRDEGWTVGNLDLVVVAQEPRLAPHLQGMRERVAEALGVNANVVSLKAKRPEGLGALGRGEGIAAQAVALLLDISGKLG
jgi:2-C-methyl-D-erythritol 4-phosphate cytidylyltransferase/2-C-methyl-D-erythritol 2,4-cyclodiphosphate synthase